MVTAIELRGIGKRFPGVIANHDIDITIRHATIHALVGENGAGKSTLMKILYGVQKPDDGSISVNGRPVSFSTPADAIAEGIGMVFQHFMLADNFTVLENVTLGAEQVHGIGDAAREAITEISRKYHFDLDPDELVETLGVGERGGFYETTGAVRDIVQNHVLQVLSLFLLTSTTSVSPSQWPRESPIHVSISAGLCGLPSV